MNLLLTAPDIQRQLAERVRAMRLQAGWKQSSLAERAGVSLTTLQRFEQTGVTSLPNFLRLVAALGQLHGLSDLLLAPPASSMAALAAQAVKANQAVRKRGRQ